MPCTWGCQNKQGHLTTGCRGWAVSGYRTQLDLATGHSTAQQVMGFCFPKMDPKTPLLQHGLLGTKGEVTEGYANNVSW